VEKGQDSRGQRQWHRAEQMKSRTCDFSSALGHILKYVRLAFTITFSCPHRNTHTRTRTHTNAHTHTFTETEVPTLTHMHINGGMMRQLSLRVCCCSQKGYKWLRLFRCVFSPARSTKPGVCVCVCLFRFGLLFFGFMCWCACVYIYLFQFQ